MIDLTLEDSDVTVCGEENGNEANENKENVPKEDATFTLEKESRPPFGLLVLFFLGYFWSLAQLRVEFFRFFFQNFFFKKFFHPK